jgi:hypothetical protein
MKVDKSVCTNDIHDLNRVIKFEKIFATLVENKVLAIKRDCEQKKRSKRLRSIRRILICKKKDLNETALFQPNAKERKKSASNSENVVKKDNYVDTIKLYDFQTSVKATDIDSVAKDDKEIEEDELTTDINDENIEQAAIVPTADKLPEYDVKIFEKTDKDIDRLSPIEKYSKDILEDASLCEIRSTLSDPIHSVRKHLINNQLGKSPKSVSAQSSPILTNKRLEISLGSDINCSTESQHSKNASSITQQQHFSKISDKQSATATTSNLNLKNNESLTNNNQINNTEKTSPNKNIKTQIKSAKNSTLSSSKINKSNNNSVKKKSKHLKTIRGDALTIGLPHHLEYELEDYGDDDDDKSQHGFISSFNQLTTNVRVIAATKPKKSICNKSHLDKVVSTSSSAKIGTPDSVNKEIDDIECRTTTTVAVELCNETITAKKKRGKTFLIIFKSNQEGVCTNGLVSLFVCASFHFPKLYLVYAAILTLNIFDNNVYS